MSQNVIQKYQLAQTIKQLAAERKIPVSSLEQRANYSPGTFSRWSSIDSGEFNVLTKLSAIADILGVTIDQLLDRSPSPAEAASSPPSANPALCLLEATKIANITWSSEPPSSAEEMEVSPNGRPLAEVWKTRQSGIDFLLMVYCDDPDDDSEPMEFALYSAVRHGIPPLQVPAGDIRVFQQLYSQVRVQHSCQSLPGISSANSGGGNHPVQADAPNRRSVLVEFDQAKPG